MKTSQHKNQRGMSLIEILVAVFVVSIGLLGVARMELLAKQSNAEAIQRTSASQLANDMMEKMRANPKTLNSYVGITVGTGTLAQPGADCMTTACLDTQLASWQIWQWEQSLIGAGEQSGGKNAGGLENPRGCINGPAGGSGEYTIAIVWRGKTPSPNPATTNCGNGANLYGSNEKYRRVITMTFFVSSNGI
jgi:type IV pilus assembly protein PilV